MNHQQALEAIVGWMDHEKSCPRCLDIQSGSCDRCFKGEDFEKAAGEAIQWYRSTKTKPPLTPPDLQRCQADIREGSFMTLGPRKWERCKNRPSVIVRETEPGKDGLRGAMALCPGCLEQCRKQMGDKIDVLTMDEYFNS